MSTRKRPIKEIPIPSSTPSRYAPSTPHAIRALQQRSGAKTRTIRTIRSARYQTTEAVRPDSIRGILRQFAKISAPVTRKRVVTPTSVNVDKENQRPHNVQEDDNDSTVLKPHFAFAIEESLDEDSDLPVAPTPSVLPDEEDYEQPTVTFQNVAHIPIQGWANERSSRRRSRISEVHSEPLVADEQDEDEQEADVTIMTERGRRALSEEATGRLSRYSFGSIRMSDFGSELEIRRQSAAFHKPAVMALDDYVELDGDDLMVGGDTEDLRKLVRSPPADGLDDTVQLSGLGDETFRLEIPPGEDEADAQAMHMNALKDGGVVLAQTSSEQNRTLNVASDQELELNDTARRQTLLETATTQSHTSRRKRLKLTRHGTLIPCLPASVVRKVVLDSYEKQSKRKPKLGRDHMKALEQATEWFFEQAAEDLAAYSSHGRRKKRVNTDDVFLLLRRQKILNDDGELRKMAKGWLSRDAFEGLDLPDGL